MPTIVIVFILTLTLRAAVIVRGGEWVHLLSSQDIHSLIDWRQPHTDTDQKATSYPII